MRIGRQHQLTQFVLDRRRLGGGGVDLGDEHVTLRTGRTGEHVAGRVAIGPSRLASPVRVDHRTEFVVPLGQPTQFVGIGQDVRIRQLLFDGLVLVDDVAEAFEHGHPRLLARQRRRPGARC